MNTATHPNDNELYDYSKEPEQKQYFSLRAHLLSCSQCQQRLNSIQQTEQWLLLKQGHSHEAETQSNSTQSNSIQSNDEALQHNELKASLHNAAHRAAMRVASLEAERIAEDFALNQPQTSSPQTLQHPANQPSPLIEKMTEKIKQVMNEKISLWFSVPVTAAAAFFLAIFLQPLLQPFLQTHDQSSSAVIAVYQDNPVVSFTANPPSPGIGFFNAAKQTTSPYKGITITQDTDTKETLHLSWPAIEEAQSYTIRLFLQQGHGQQEVASITTTDTHAQFNKLTLIPERRYGWELTGKTKSQDFFTSTGGFVVSD